MQPRPTDSVRNAKPRGLVLKWLCSMLQVFCNISSFWPNGMDYGAHPDRLPTTENIYTHVTRTAATILALWNYVFSITSGFRDPKPGINTARIICRIWTRFQSITISSCIVAFLPPLSTVLFVSRTRNCQPASGCTSF